eukprot:TRINITY_DN98653_c0_g1_i1.p1 TRINITY_DN98653_c0_g1~~TRINITY_DN98653_c0_g1_i1.p1  ORF type:complete len:85 (-),score=28.11 TRINITY_DN98653_c0_g1_i1:30-257(-)
MVKAPNTGLIKGHITYTVSPFAQKAFYNYFQNALPEIKKRVRGNWFSVGTAFLLGGLVYSWAQMEDENEHRKHRF